MTIKKNKLEDDPIFKEDIAPKIKSGIKRSVFDITINTNKNYDNMSDDDKLKFKNVIQYLFTNGSENILNGYLVDDLTQMILQPI